VTRNEAPPRGNLLWASPVSCSSVLLELVLEALDLLRERRLRDEQPLGRARERALVLDRDHVLQLPKVHGCGRNRYRSCLSILE
jgi:hypothetical protein